MRFVTLLQKRGFVSGVAACLAGLTGCVVGSNTVHDLPPSMQLATKPSQPVGPEMTSVVFIGDRIPDELTIVDERANVYGQLVTETYFSAAVAPGRHVFVPYIKGGSLRPVQVDLAAGRQYYILASETGGAFGVGAELVALGSAAPQRQNVRAWLATYRRMEPAAGMLESMDRVQRRTWESVVRRGLRTLQGYSSSEFATHSLKVDDGDAIQSGDASAAGTSRRATAVGRAKRGRQCEPRASACRHVHRRFARHKIRASSSARRG
jgi:hypothetical protein